jgi:hypothetical protein
MLCSNVLYTDSTVNAAKRPSEKFPGGGLAGRAAGGFLRIL